MIVNLLRVHNLPLLNVAEEAGVSTRTVRNVNKQFYNPLVMKEKHAKLEQKWWKQEQLKGVIVEMMEARNKILTADDIRANIRTKFQYNVPKSFVRRILSEEGYNWKRLRQIQSYVNTPDNINKR